MSCNPKQSDFLKVTGKEPAQTDPHKEMLSELSYNMSLDMAQAIFDSCVNVQMPAGGIVVVQQFFCDGSSDCTAQKFFNYAGKKDPSPFQIDFDLTDRKDGLFVEPVSCTEAPKGYSELTCSCIDCPARCEPKPIHYPNEDKQWFIWGMDGMWFVMGVVFYAVVVVIIGGFLLSYFRSKNGWFYSHLFAPNPESTISSTEEHTPLVQRTCSEENVISSELNSVPNQSSVVSRLLDAISLMGFAFEAKVRKVFRKYGTLCAKKPFIYLFPISGIALALVLSVGVLTHFETMTDPVSLWSATNSRARLEKNFFDENFGPFYRTEQVIIHPKDQSVIMYNNSKGYTLFGPAFNKQFLLRVLDLQKQITDINVDIDGKQVHLTDLCFAPMKNNLCATQTPLGWFQDEASNLNLTSDDLTYLDHIRQCAQAPLTQVDPLGLKCAGEFGGPILPNVALADYEGDNHFSAKAVVLTFLLNNHISNDDNTAALEWERNYLNFMRNFSDPDMEIVYYSEVLFNVSLFL